MAGLCPPYCSEYYLLSAFTLFAIITAAIVLYRTSSCIASRNIVLCYNLWFCVSHIFPPIIKITSFSKRPSTTVKSRNSKNCRPLFSKHPKQSVNTLHIGIVWTTFFHFLCMIFNSFFYRFHGFFAKILAYFC